MKNEFRIRKMNAIELFAIQTVIDNTSYDSMLNSYKIILENMEVKCGDTWLPVKEKDREVYYPKDIENDIVTIKELILMFMKYVNEVFQKSDGLKE